MKYIFIDVETTGTDPKRHGIIQIAGAIYITNGDVPSKIEYFNYAMSPFRTDEICEEALLVNGISLEELLNDSRRRPKDVYREFSGLLSKYVDKFRKSDKFLFVGFSANFDYEFIRKFSEKCGDRYFGSYVAWPPIDVAALAALKLGEERFRMADFKLASVAKRVGLQVEEGSLHDALYDIKLTIGIFEWVFKGGI